MQDLVAPVTHIKFEMEVALDQQLGSQPLPFPGMDKSGAAICTFYLSNVCSKGVACPYRHVKGDRTVVCKHWLRGLCKKGDDCEFLHEFDMSKMPECYFFSKFGECNNKECPFLHIDPSAKIKDCPWYDRGFCRHGPNCKNRHVRRILCQCYLNGFCLEGPKCKYMHPSFDIPVFDQQTTIKKVNIVCHFCSEPGHKALNCPKMKTSDSDKINVIQTTMDTGHNAPYPQPGYGHHVHVHLPYKPPSGQDNYIDPRRPLDQVTCFKCGEKGHYANKCPKGHLAFLASSSVS